MLSTLYFLNTLNRLGSYLLSRKKSDGLGATRFPPCSDIKHWWKAVDGCTVVGMRKNIIFDDEDKNYFWL